MSEAKIRADCSCLAFQKAAGSLVDTLSSMRVKTEILVLCWTSGRK